MTAIPLPPRGTVVCVDDARDGRPYLVRLATVTERRLTGRWVFGGRSIHAPLWIVYVSHVRTEDGREHRLLQPGHYAGIIDGSARLPEELAEVYDPWLLPRPAPARGEHRARLRAWRHRPGRRERRDRSPPPARVDE